MDREELDRAAERSVDGADAPFEGELSEEELAAAAGGSMKGNIFITPTTDISDDTRRKI